MGVLVDPFEKLSEDLKATFRHQREWVDRRGLLLILAYFFSGIGAGTWVFSIFYKFYPGMLTSLGLVIVGSGVTHLLFLGKPSRFWRIVFKPEVSWISRGLIGMAFFSLFAILYILPHYLPALPWEAGVGAGRVFFVLSVIGAAWLFIYKGCVFAVSRAIPFWNTPLLPALFITYAGRGGAAVLLLLAAIMGGGALEVETIESLKFWIVATSAVLILLYLWGMNTGGVAQRQAVLTLIRGRAVLSFYVGVVAVGLLVPLVWGGIGLVTTLSALALALIGLASLIGDFYFTYAVARAGVYLPLVGEFPVPR